MGRGLFDRLERELATRERSPGLSMSDVLLLPEPLDRLTMWMLRQRQVSIEDVVEFLKQDEQRVQQCLGKLLERGFIRKVTIGETTTYQVRLAPRRKRQLPLDLWQALEDKVEKKEV